MTVSEDLPTPPLPEPTQVMFATWASAPSGSPPVQPLLLLVGEDVEGDVDVRDPFDAARGGDDGGLEVASDRAPGRRQRHGHVGDTAVGDLDRPDHPQRDDVLPELRVDDDPQGLEDLLSRGHDFHSGSLVKEPSPPPEGNGDG